MAATLAWEASNGGTAAFAAVTYLRFKAADDNTNDNNNPLVRPSSTGTNYSYEKATRVNVTVAPASQLSNLRVLLGTASIGTGLLMWRRFTGTYTGPVQPSAQGTNGATPAGGFTALIDTETSWANSGTKTGTGVWGDMLYLVLGVDNTNGGGPISSFNIIARYDEI